MMPAVESDDIIAMLQHHHPDPTPEQRWKIEISDDFSTHGTDAVKDVQWSKKKFGMNLGGGVTGGQQPCDGALNQHVRRQYGMLESNKLNYAPNDERCQLANDDRCIQPRDSNYTPAGTSASTCTCKRLIKGFTEAGLSVDLDGNEDFEIAKEAALQPPH